MNAFWILFQPSVYTKQLLKHNRQNICKNSVNKTKRCQTQWLPNVNNIYCHHHICIIKIQGTWTWRHKQYALLRQNHFLHMIFVANIDFVHLRKIKLGEFTPFFGLTASIKGKVLWGLVYCFSYKRLFPFLHSFSWQAQACNPPIKDLGSLVNYF